MFWKVKSERRPEPDAVDRVDGRFVLHRHRDVAGAHLDLRLEQDGYLVGWRIDGLSLDGEPWATRKAPHAAYWLDSDGDAVRVDRGVYQWVEHGRERCVLMLQGAEETRRVSVEREPGLPAVAVRAACEAIALCGVDGRDVGRFIVDGVTARRRAAERLCGLGRELDGSAFDEGVWRKVLNGLSLEEIHAQLRAFEVRFDEKYPPTAVSQPEQLPDSEAGDRTEKVFSILCE